MMQTNDGNWVCVGSNGSPDANGENPCLIELVKVEGGKFAFRNTANGYFLTGLSKNYF